MESFFTRAHSESIEHGAPHGRTPQSGQQAPNTRQPATDGIVSLGRLDADRNMCAELADDGRYASHLKRSSQSASHG